MIGSTGAWLRWIAIVGTVRHPDTAGSLARLPRLDLSGYRFLPGHGRGAIHGSPAVLLKNAYWSPAYPAIMALAMAVAKPSPAAELNAMYVVHWLIFLVTTACFSRPGYVFAWLRRNSWPELARDATLYSLLRVRPFPGVEHEPDYLVSHSRHVTPGYGLSVGCMFAFGFSCRIRPGNIQQRSDLLSA